MRKLLFNLVWLFRLWLFKKVFGVDLRELNKLYKNQTRVVEKLSKFNQEIYFLASRLEETREMIVGMTALTGGPGWTQTMQNAIMNLDGRLEEMRQMLVQHQQNLNIIAAERAQLTEMADKAPKKQLN